MEGREGWGGQALAGDLTTVICTTVSNCSYLHHIVRPNRPFFNDEHIPLGQFDERTPLAELKRMFESLDEIPASQSHVTHDSAEDGPVAWYEPQEDEPFYDKGSKCWITAELIDSV